MPHYYDAYDHDKLLRRSAGCRRFSRQWRCFRSGRMTRRGSGSGASYYSISNGLPYSLPTTMRPFITAFR